MINIVCIKITDRIVTSSVYVAMKYLNSNNLINLLDKS